MLHLIFQPSPEPALFDRMASGDSAVFLESGVLNVLRNGRLSGLLESRTADIGFYVLAEDMAIRGIDASELIAGFEVVDYDGLVRLTVENPLIQSWC